MIMVPLETLLLSFVLVWKRGSQQLHHVSRCLQVFAGAAVHWALTVTVNVMFPKMQIKTLWKQKSCFIESMVVFLINRLSPTAPSRAAVVYFPNRQGLFLIMFSAAFSLLTGRTDERCLPPSPSPDKLRCYADAVLTFHHSVITTPGTLISMRRRSRACIIFAVSCHTMATRGHTLII